MVDDPVVDERGDDTDNHNRKHNPQNISHRGRNYTNTTVVWGRRERNMLSFTARAVRERLEARLGNARRST